MMRASSLRPALLAAVVCLSAVSAQVAGAQPVTPVSYTVRIAAPDTQTADVEAVFPTGAGPSLDLMMAIWSPGFYRVEDYATRVQNVSARSPDGAVLEIARPQSNRWRITTHGAATVTVTYRVLCTGRSVTTNWIGNEYAILNGAPTFITLADEAMRARRPHDVRLELPAAWQRSVTALDAAPDGAPHHYRAPDYDTLVDSPIVAGNPAVQELAIGGSAHVVVEIGDVGGWDATRAVRDLQKIVEAHRTFWGGLPFPKYVFLLAFRPGGGGLEHASSMLATMSAATMNTPAAYRRWLTFISHEYCHAFNVKRLRPVELGPFDYEHPVRTSGLWISEGFTTYVGDLAVTRAGLSTGEEFLASLSSQIDKLQRSPGRLVQTLEQSSLDVWTSEGTSGVGTNANTAVSYYIKGQIAGFLLDARIRHASSGAKTLDDVMRLALQRYGGARGFTADEFLATAEEVARAGLGDWFRRTAASPEELSYTEALDWFGLRFKPDTWTLEPRADATPAQRSHLEALFLK